MRSRVYLLATALLAALGGAGAAVAWHRVAVLNREAAQISPAIAALFGGLSVIGLACALFSIRASRLAAATRRARRIRVISLATAAARHELSVKP